MDGSRQLFSLPRRHDRFRRHDRLVAQPLALPTIHASDTSATYKGELTSPAARTKPVVALGPIRIEPELPLSARTTTLLRTGLDGHQSNDFGFGARTQQP